MPITSNISLRDMVKLAVLVCSDRSSAKYWPPVSRASSTASTIRTPSYS